LGPVGGLFLGPKGRKKGWFGQSLLCNLVILPRRQKGGKNRKRTGEGQFSGANLKLPSQNRG